ncbi:glycosyltransferase 8 domain-containing protein 2-like [Gigantopelta aegis]|uniref:glycosyltransferase 8 domain-containing protein 2-like n=1 Tax=Gigantopelta aegis TaxID=1735272 RepID=UPI001B88A2C8|nr:glycosyltransferase 8 domain-containing protein 2-like [Gigantopelta aegis]
MGICSPKRVGVLLVFLWIATLCYLWFPDLVPDVLNLRSKSTKTAKAKHASRMSHVSGNVTSGETIHVCITSDKNTLGGAVALINSIVSNTKSNVMFHIVTDEESMDHLSIWIMKSKLKDINYEMKAFNTKWVEGKINVRGGRLELASPLNYARYYLPKLFPKLSEKIIFIDDDCIVQGDISELYRLKFNKGHIAAFSEDCVGASKRLTHMKNNYADYIDFKNKQVKLMKIKPTTCSFNSGLFVTDLSAWRKQRITEQLEYWMQLNTKEEVYGNERGGGGSQPPMMLVFYKKYTEIPPTWHVRYLGWTPGTSYTKQFIRGAKLLHWNGRFKPWGRQTQHVEVWNKYYLTDPTGTFKPVRRS